MGVLRGVDWDGKGKCGCQPTRTGAGEGHGVRRNLTRVFAERDSTASRRCPWRIGSYAATGS